MSVIPRTDPRANARTPAVNALLVGLDAGQRGAALRLLDLAHRLGARRPANLLKATALLARFAWRERRDAGAKVLAERLEGNRALALRACGEFSQNYGAYNRPPEGLD